MRRVSAAAHRIEAKNGSQAESMAMGQVRWAARTLRADPRGGFHTRLSELSTARAGAGSMLDLAHSEGEALPLAGVVACISELGKVKELISQRIDLSADRRYLALLGSLERKTRELNASELSACMAAWHSLGSPGEAMLRQMTSRFVEMLPSAEGDLQSRSPTPFAAYPSTCNPVCYHSCHPTCHPTPAMAYHSPNPSHYVCVGLSLIRREVVQIPWGNQRPSCRVPCRLSIALWSWGQLGFYPGDEALGAVLSRLPQAGAHETPPTRPSPCLLIAVCV